MSVKMALGILHSKSCCQTLPERMQQTMHQEDTLINIANALILLHKPRDKSCIRFHFRQTPFLWSWHPICLKFAVVLLSKKFAVIGISLSKPQQIIGIPCRSAPQSTDSRLPVVIPSPISDKAVTAACAANSATSFPARAERKAACSKIQKQEESVEV